MLQFGYNSVIFDMITILEELRMLFGKKNMSEGLNIIIVGCGLVGSTLVEQLSGEGHDITVIDKNPAVIQQLTNQYDIMGVCGNGASFSVQIEAGIKEANLIIAVTQSDELNLLCGSQSQRLCRHCPCTQPRLQP